MPRAFYIYVCVDGDQQSKLFYFRGWRFSNTLLLMEDNAGTRVCCNDDNIKLSTPKSKGFSFYSFLSVILKLPKYCRTYFYLHTILRTCSFQNLFHQQIVHILEYHHQHIHLYFINGKTARLKMQIISESTTFVQVKVSWIVISQKKSFPRLRLPTQTNAKGCRNFAGSQLHAFQILMYHKSQEYETFFWKKSHFLLTTTQIVIVHKTGSMGRKMERPCFIKYGNSYTSQATGHYCHHR